MPRTTQTLVLVSLALSLSLTQACGRSGRRVAVDPNAAKGTDVVATLSGIAVADLARDWFTYVMICDAAATPITGTRGPEKDIVVVSFPGTTVKDGASCSVGVQGTPPAADAPAMAPKEGFFYKSAPAAIALRKLAVTMTMTYGPATPVDKPQEPGTETPPVEKPPVEEPPTEVPPTEQPPADDKDIGVNVQAGGECRYWNPETWQCE